ncbi:MAG TPA: ABC transporter substrate-binding protein [Mycobacteriales bacterium]|nr:ABC transporter substrate-binding protein [Mycobacteriales bacterium]
MARRSRGLIGIAALVTVAAVACSSGSSGGSSPSTTKTIKIGLLTDVTGLAASGEQHIQDGVKAGIYAAGQDGYHIQYVVADSQTSPSAVLSAAQKLVNQDHVQAVIASSALTFGAAPWLAAHHIPVVGAAIDGPEWAKYANMFSVNGPIDTTKVTTLGGDFFKLVGGTNVGSLGYAISPTSAESAKATAISAEHAGLKAGYVNAAFPFGSTNVQPIAIAMKNKGIDSLAPQVDPNTSFALITALRNEGVDLKAALLPIGYGGDLLDAGPGEKQAAQGVYFTVFFQPIEMDTPGTKSFLANLKASGGTQTPSQPTYTGYVSVLLLEAGLKNAGANPTSTSILNGLTKVTSFDAGGLANAPYNPRNLADVSGPNNCEYTVKFVGDAFQLVKGADPICGTVIPGETVSG